MESDPVAPSSSEGSKAEAVKGALATAISGFVYGFLDGKPKLPLAVPSIKLSPGRAVISRGANASSLIYAITEVRPADVRAGCRCPRALRRRDLAPQQHMV